MKIERRSFSKGYYFKRFEGEPTLEILTSKIPEEVAIPLKHGFGEEVPALVKRGDVVKAGQIIGRDDETISSPVHSSVSGTVNTVEREEYFGEELQTVFITPEGSHEWQPIEGYSPEWRDLPVSKIEELLYLSGVTSLGASGIPTRYKSSPISPSEVKEIIVHHTEDEVFNDSLDILLKDDRLHHFVEGLMILKTLMPDVRIHLAFNSELTNWLTRIADLSKESFLYYALKPKYPQHRSEVLIPTIIGKKIPPSSEPVDIGVLTFTVQDVLHIYEAVVKGKPLIERLVTLAGPGFEQCPYLQVKIGTPFQDIVIPRVKQDQELRFVLNSLLTGKTIVDLIMPVTSECSRIIALKEERDGPLLPFVLLGIKSDSYTNVFLSRFWPENNPFLSQFLPTDTSLSRFLPKSKFLSRFLPVPKCLNTNVHGEKRGCLSCGLCSDCCPAGLYPNYLHHYVERERFDEALVKFGIFKCLECNLCTYVCPSKIPVAKLLKEGKEQLLHEGFSPDDVKTSFADIVADFKDVGYLFIKDLVNLFMEW